MARAYREDPASELSDAEILQDAGDLVDDFLVFVRHRIGENDILDVSALPASKVSLANAFRLIIATEARPDYRRQLVKAGLLLSRFQENVGEPMSLVPVSAASAAPLEEIDLLMAEHRNYIARFDRAFAQIGPDLRRLGSLFEESLRIAQRREQQMNGHRAQAGGAFQQSGHH